jgi:hypothetical protein
MRMRLPSSKTELPRLRRRLPKLLVGCRELLAARAGGVPSIKRPEKLGDHDVSVAIAPPARCWPHSPTP